MLQATPHPSTETTSNKHFSTYKRPSYSTGKKERPTTGDQLSPLRLHLASATGLHPHRRDEFLHWAQGLTPTPRCPCSHKHPSPLSFPAAPQCALLLCSFQPPSSLVLLFTAECLERGFYKDHRCFLSPSLPHHLLRLLCPLAVNAWRAGPAPPGLRIIILLHSGHTLCFKCTRTTKCFIFAPHWILTTARHGWGVCDK